MRYWEACMAQVAAEDAIEECRIHEAAAAVRKDDKALVALTAAASIRERERGLGKGWREPSPFSKGGSLREGPGPSLMG